MLAVGVPPTSVSGSHPVAAELLWRRGCDEKVSRCEPTLGAFSTSGIYILPFLDHVITKNRPYRTVISITVILSLSYSASANWSDVAVGES